MNVRQPETASAVEDTCHPAQISPFLESELAPLALVSQPIPRTLSSAYFTPPPALVIHGAEGRLIPELRAAAATHDATEILTRAAIRACQSNIAGGFPVGGDALSSALADLSVTGALARTNFAFHAPVEGQIQTTGMSRYRSLVGPQGPTPPAAQAGAAVTQVLDRAYQVA